MQIQIGKMEEWYTVCITENIERVKEKRIESGGGGELVDCCIVKYGGFLQMNTYAYLKKLYIYMSTCLVEFSLAYKNIQAYYSS